MQTDKHDMVVWGAKDKPHSGHPPNVDMSGKLSSADDGTIGAKQASEEAALPKKLAGAPLMAIELYFSMARIILLVSI